MALDAVHVTNSLRNSFGTDDGCDVVVVLLRMHEHEQCCCENRQNYCSAGGQTEEADGTKTAVTSAAEASHLR